MARTSLTRRIQFSAAHRYRQRDSSDTQNEATFGAYAREGRSIQSWSLLTADPILHQRPRAGFGQLERSPEVPMLDRKSKPGLDRKATEILCVCPA